MIKTPFFSKYISQLMQDMKNKMVDIILLPVPIYFNQILIVVVRPKGDMISLGCICSDEINGGRGLMTYIHFRGCVQGHF